MNDTPIHLRPTSCHICGSANDHGQTFTDTGKGHNFWANAEARADHEQGANWGDRFSAFRYSTGETTVEGQYVATTRGR